MNRRLVCMIILVMFLAGCSTTRMLSTPGEMHLTLYHEASITTVTGHVVSGQNILVTPETTYWNDPNSGVLRTMETRDISRIVILRRGKGMAQGLGLGTLGGVLGGFGIAVIAVPASDNELAGLGYIMGPVVGAAIGATVGSIVGVASGNREEYIFNRTTSGNMQNGVSD